MKHTNKLQDIYKRKIKAWVTQNEIIPQEQKQSFFDNFCEICLKEVKSIKDCTEKSIVNSYIVQAQQLLLKGLLINGEGYEQLKKLARNELLKIYTSKTSDDCNIIDIYFNEVKREYILHPMNESNDLDFLPENRDIFLKNNLKLVVGVAKKYTNVGVPFEDLIQAGNIGLCDAFEKYDVERTNLRSAIKRDVEAQPQGNISYDTAVEIIKRNFTYDKNLTQTLAALPSDGFTCKEEFIKWINSNIKIAVFASVAYQWIRARIIQEIDNYGKIIKIPKPKDQDKNLNVQFIYLDSINVHTNDCYHDNQISDIANDNFAVEDDAITAVDKNNAFSDIIEEIIQPLTPLEQRVIKKKFGVGYPYQLNPLEIAESEGLSPNKIKYILQVSLKKIQENITPERKKIICDVLYDDI